ncbi:hypothetical protein TNCV_4478031 [Trichonephila clavipes]|nr:hypothetical protein TNCV_4478031 [Trichonephila clavipes]
MEKEDIEIQLILYETFEKFSVLMECPIVSYEEFVAADDDYVCTPVIMADKDILKFLQNFKEKKSLIEIPMTKID